MADEVKKVPKRPTMLNDYVASEAAIKLFEKIFYWEHQRSFDNSNSEDVEFKDETIQQLTEAIGGGYPIDGYRIARQLDYKGWDADEELVEILSRADSYCRQALNKCIEDWVTAYQIKPAYRVGDKVKIMKGSGTIDEIDYLHAIYFIKLTNDVSESRRYLIPYEEVKLDIENV